jgi:hypothetical protein
MKTAGPSIGVIRAQIRAIRDKAPHARAFGIFTHGRWSGKSPQSDGEHCIAVYQCDSPLQMRLALQEVPAEATATVLITPLDQSKISDDILMRLAHRRLHSLNSWEIVRQLFQARHLDPRVTRHAFLADLLLEHLGTRSFPPVAGGLVDAETIWSILLEERLGLSGPRPDLVEILRATVESDLANRWRQSSEEFRTAATQWIGQHGGDSTMAMLSCAAEEHGEKALAIGLVMGVLFDEGVGHELDKAAGRLETFVGVDNLPVEDARRWRDAASDCLARLDRPQQRQCLDDAEEILRTIGADQHAWRSTELDSGLEQRLARLGQAFGAHITNRAKTVSQELEGVYHAVRTHHRARRTDRRMVRAEMALRLSRWLAEREAEPKEIPTTLEESAKRFAADGALVDWARQALRGGEANQELSASYTKLVERATELRETENRQFASLLVEQTVDAPGHGTIIPVEHIVEQVVAKAAEHAPVLVLLLDGMSCAVFRELAGDVKEHDWIEVGFSGKQQRPVGLAALPSVTAVCRTSLFTGSLRRGQASNEVKGFASHPALQQLSSPGLAPRLFHKASLEGAEDSSLAGEVRKAIAEKKQRVVGIVVNAVDDYLDKGDQIDVAWTIQQIRVLEPILAEAKKAGRIVILLSDHGHVCERQTELRDGDDAIRWRPAQGSVGEGELEITSPRVVGPEGGRIIVPWTEKLRYGTKKNGYHGGATPQEMLIPIGLFSGDIQLPDGLDELPVDLPAWWTEPAGPGIDRRAVPRLSTKPKKPVAPTLFDPETEAPTPSARPEWVKGLLASEVLTRQKQMAGRARVTDDQIESVVMSLANRGGTMTGAALASAMGLTAHRLSGMLAVMQRILNVEGYPILDRQEASDTVVLNIQLLKKQFELSE